MKKHLAQKNYPMAFIGNMDETPVYFDLVPRLLTGLERSHALSGQPELKRDISLFH